MHLWLVDLNPPVKIKLSLPLSLSLSWQISNSNTQGINPQERHCGSKGMQIFTSAGPKFYVHFKTDGSHNGRGFEANYRIVKSSEYLHA